jgi:hypothetical protein
MWQSAQQDELELDMAGIQHRSEDNSSAMRQQ